MPLSLIPYVSPLDNYMHNFDLIRNYFNTPNCDYQIDCNDGLDWEDEKLVEIIVRVCSDLNIDPKKVTISSRVLYSSDTGIKFVLRPLTHLFALGLFADNMQNNYFEKNQNVASYFLSMTNNPIWDRLCVASFLYKYHRSRSKIKFPLHDDYVQRRSISTSQRGLGIDMAFAKYYTHKERASQILDFLSVLPIDDVKEKWTKEELMQVVLNQSQFHSYDLYQTVAVEIVNETNITKGFFVTEKTVRPIAYYTPFVVMATANFLKNFRTLGFKTFGTVWDESYDELEGKDRLEKIYQTINEIAKMDCKDIQRQTHDICVYNKSVLDSYQWKKKFNDIKV